MHSTATATALEIKQNWASAKLSKEISNSEMQE
jgi:hypothetical protein